MWERRARGWRGWSGVSSSSLGTHGHLGTTAGGGVLPWRVCESQSLAQALSLFLDARLGLADSGFVACILEIVKLVKAEE